VKDRDVLDALLISGFFLGYAMVLAIARRAPRPATSIDFKRLTFMRDLRGKLIEQENMEPVDAAD
jgi:hypothetical protein